MNFKILLPITFLVLSITGCAKDASEKKIRKQEEDTQQVALDHNQCVSYGFPPNTTEYSNCRMKLDQQRLAAQNTIAPDTGHSKKDPNKVCHKQHCY